MPVPASSRNPEHPAQVRHLVSSLARAKHIFCFQASGDRPGCRSPRPRGSRGALRRYATPSRFSNRRGQNFLLSSGGDRAKGRSPLVSEAAYGNNRKAARNSAIRRAPSVHPNGGPRWAPNVHPNGGPKRALGSPRDKEGPKRAPKWGPQESTKRAPKWGPQEGIRRPTE